MFVKALLLVLVVATVAFVSAEEAKKEEEEARSPHILYLDDSNFDSEIAKWDTVLVAGTATWCGHCVRMKPAMASAAEKLAAEVAADPASPYARAKFAIVDAEKNGKTAGKLKVSGFPTIRFVLQGEVAGDDYNGGRDEAALLEELKKKAAMPVLKEITDAKEFAATTKIASMNSGPRLVGIFASKTSVDFKYFRAVAMGLAGTGLEVFWSAAPSVLETVGFYGSGSAISIYRPGAKPPKVTYRGTVFKADLQAWVLANVLPPDGVATYTSANAKLFEKTGASLVVVHHDGKNPAVLSTLTAAAKAGTSKDVLFATSGWDEFAKQSEALCGKDAAQAKLCVVGKYGSKANKGGAEHGMEASFSAATFDAWLNRFIEKKLKQKLKSEPVPSEGPVAGKKLVVVGNTFEQYVQDEKSKAQFIFFGAGYCGHCKKATPAFEETAAAYADKFDKVMFVYMDADANEMPAESRAKYAISGFPTFYFKKADGSVVKHDGGRSVDDFKKFIDAQI